MNNQFKSLIIIFTFTLIFLFGCVSADKNESEFTLNKDNLQSSICLNQRYDFNGLNINLVIADESRGFFQNIINSISVDNQKSAYEYLLKNYYVSYISIENTTEQKMFFNTNLICLAVDNTELNPIMKENLPEKLKRFNMKGTMKNVYNTGAICAVTAFVVFAVVASGKKGGTLPLNIFADVSKLSQSGETDTVKLFSSFVHKTGVQYEGVLNKETILEPKQKAEGIIFFEKKEKQINSFVKLFYKQNQKIELKKI